MNSELKNETKEETSLLAIYNWAQLEPFMVFEFTHLYEFMTYFLSAFLDFFLVLKIGSLENYWKGVSIFKQISLSLLISSKNPMKLFPDFCYKGLCRMGQIKRKRHIIMLTYWLFNIMLSN